MTEARGIWVVSVVDRVDMPWPPTEELVKMGVPERIAVDWEAMRERMSPESLRMIVEWSRN